MRRNIKSSTKLRICSKKARGNSLAFLRHDGAPNSRSSCCAAQIFPRGGEIFSLPVARWGATFCSFRGIGRGGTAAPLGFFCRGREPQHPPMRGGQSPPLRSTYGWAYPAHTRGSFRFTTKGTKGVPGRCPWTPLGGRLKSVPLFSPIPPATLCVAPPRKGKRH